MKQFNASPSNQVTSLFTKWAKVMVISLSCMSLATLALAAPSATEQQQSALQLQNQLLKQSLIQAKSELAQLKEEMDAYKQLSSTTVADNSAEDLGTTITQAYTEQSKKLLKQQLKFGLLQKMTEEIYLTLSQSQELQDQALKQEYINTALLALSKGLNSLRTQQNLEAQVAQGLLQTKVKAIDVATGLIVLEQGADVGVQIGMRFEIRRNEQLLAQATVVDIREQVSGAFLDATKFKITDLSVGDDAYLIRTI